MVGVRSVVAAAKGADKGGRSGGVDIVWRGHLNVTSPQIVHPHRAVSVELHTHDAGDLLITCVYGDVAGSWKAQAPMWKSISKATARSGKPFLWGGDWNASPAEVQEILASMNIPGGHCGPHKVYLCYPQRRVGSRFFR